MMRSSLSGATVATAAVTDQAVCQVWNPSAVPIWLKELHIFKLATGGADILKIRRSSARGTSASSLTAAIANDHDRMIAPPSGWILDLDWSAEPTPDGNFLYSLVAPASIGVGAMWVFEEPIKVGPAAGLTVISGLASFPVAWVSAVVLE